MSQSFNFIVKIPDQEPTQYVLDAQNISIGRHPDNKIQILVAEVSGKHAELVRGEGGGYSITELGSSNGTKVNGTKITPGEAVELKDGDELLLGETIPVEFNVEGKEDVPVAQAAPAQVPATSPTGPALKKPSLKLAKKKIATPLAKPAETEAPTPVATAVPQAEAGSPTVILKKPGEAAPEPATGAKTVGLTAGGGLAKKKLGLPAKKVGLRPPPVQNLRPPTPATPVEQAPEPEPDPEPEPEPEVVVPAPRKLAPPPKPAPSSPPAATAPPAEPAASEEATEKPRPSLKLAKKKLAAPGAKAPENQPEPPAQPEPVAVVAEPDSEPVAVVAESDDEDSKPAAVAVVSAPEPEEKKSEEPVSKPEATEAKPEEPASKSEEPEAKAVPTPVDRPKIPLKLAKKKLAAPGAKPPAAPEAKEEAKPAESEEKEKSEEKPESGPAEVQKPKLPVKLAKKKLATPVKKPEAPAPVEEAAEEKPAPRQLDQDSKGVTLMRKADPPADPEATPVLKKSEAVDDAPPSLAVREEAGEVTLKKADPKPNDDPPKLVVPKKQD